MRESESEREREREREREKDIYITSCNLGIFPLFMQNRLHHVIVEFEEEESVLSILKK